MCVTFTGCELLCCETSNWQQKSHATLKSKLRVQIKMKVMKDRNAKACRGFVWTKPVSARDGVRGGLVFPGGVRKATDRVCDSPARGPRAGSSPVEPGMGPGATAPHSPLLGRRGAWGSQADGSGSQKVTRWRFYDSGEKPSARRVSPPGKAEGGSHVRHWAWLKRRPRLNVSANKIYKNLSKWTSRWVGGGLTWTLT